MLEKISLSTQEKKSFIVSLKNALKAPTSLVENGSNERGWKSGKIVNESFNCLGLIAKRSTFLAKVEMEEISIRNDDRCSCIVYVIRSFE